MIQRTAHQIEKRCRDMEPFRIKEKNIKILFNNISIVYSIGRSVLHKLINTFRPFTSSEQYWVERYDKGRSSGNGSYGKLAEFKAEIINEFIFQNKVRTVIEFGCGDGNQLKLSSYPSYIGFDISPKAVKLCSEIFSKDETKIFKMMNEYKDETAELTLSLDVIYHLIEENVFYDYMNRLFDSSLKYVIIYSSDTDVNSKIQAPHVKHRKFTKWVHNMKPEWELIKYIQNKYPLGATKSGSLADFFIYRKIS